MKEYIERAHLLKNLGYDETRRDDVLPGSTFDIVLKEPAADVAEVKHGEWVDFIGNPVAWDKEHKDCPEGNAVCSKCGRWLVASDEYLTIGRYCPNCGALMKEDEHEAG